MGVPRICLTLLLVLLAAAPAVARPWPRGDEPSVAVAADGRVAVAWAEGGERVRVALGTLDGAFAPVQDVALAGPAHHGVRQVVVLLAGDGATIVAWEHVEDELWEGDRLPRRFTSIRAAVAPPGAGFGPVQVVAERGVASSLLSAATDAAGRVLLAFGRDGHGLAAVRERGDLRFDVAELGEELAQVEAAALGGGGALLAANGVCERAGCLLGWTAPGREPHRLGPSGNAAAAMNEGGEGLLAWRDQARAWVVLRTPAGAWTPAAELPGGGFDRPAAGITAAGEALVLYDVAEGNARTLRLARRSPGATAFTLGASPAAGAPAMQPSLALAPGGGGIAAWHDGRSVRASQRDAGGGWHGLDVSGFSAATEAVAASDAGAAFAWTAEDMVRVLVAKADGASGTVVLSRHRVTDPRPVARHANPEPRWRLPKGQLRLTVRRGVLTLPLACGPQRACRGRLLARDRRLRLVGRARVRMRAGGQQDVRLRLRRRLRVVNLELDVTGVGYSLHRRVHLRLR